MSDQATEVNDLLRDVIPDVVQRRLDTFNTLADRSPRVDRAEITVLLGPVNSKSDDFEGKSITIQAGETTPIQILKTHAPEIKDAVVASLDGTLWDLNRPIAAPGKLVFLTFEDPRGRTVFWHSSAHVLGAAIEVELNTELAIGPATENGFFYDFEPTSTHIDPGVLAKIQKRCEQMAKKADFERKQVLREEALSLFAENKYKVEILMQRVEPGSLVSIYRTGTFVDLCRGPHLPTASSVKAWSITDVSGCLWAGRAETKLSRIRAITFPTAAQLKDHKHFLEEAAKRDHRKLGVDHNLFFFHQWSPGAAFFYPDGYHIYLKLMEMIRVQYKKRGFVEVMTPNLYYDDLFRTSGHWEHYRDDMFHFAVDDPSDEPAEGAGACCCAEVCHRELALKPMNCPGHCLVFRSRERSYREMPIRMAEFGVLHRNEATGALSGLTRVRRFIQDDAHIFARHDQIGQEIESGLDFMKEVYGYFGMSLEFTLSTINLQKYMGELAVWDRATALLRETLVRGGFTFTEAPGEAAFYGPKIDVQVKDCLGRKFQLATIQLDFQLPEKFNLSYVDADHKPQRPVMIHRAVLGSLERFIGIAVEHFAGRFPFWMSPHQVVLIPQNMSKPEHLEHCRKLWNILHEADFTVDIEDADVTMAKKIVRARQDRLAHAILIIGDQEIANDSVTVRWWHTPEKAKLEPQPFESFLTEITAKRAKYQ